MRPAPFVVKRARRETHDVVTLELRPEGGRFPFLPGQFTMVYAFGVGEVPLSISGDPGRPGVLVHTLRAVGAVTRAIAAARPGAVLGVRGPYGSAWPVEAAEGSDVVLLAGGMGLAPLRPVLYRILARRDRYGRVVVLYGTRTPQDLLFGAELAKWRKRFDLQVEVTVDRVPEGRWKGDVGSVVGLLPRASFDPAKAAAFVCGPEVMMRYGSAALRERGVPDARIAVSAERNMKCAVGYCGHCQLGPAFVCKDGPVFPWPALGPLLAVREL
jgi:NAD(P)H-flavin reductase